MDRATETACWEEFETGPCRGTIRIDRTRGAPGELGVCDECGLDYLFIFGRWTPVRDDGDPAPVGVPIP
jgi:hypothetical protein